MYKIALNPSTEYLYILEFTLQRMVHTWLDVKSSLLMGFIEEKI